MVYWFLWYSMHWIGLIGQWRHPKRYTRHNVDIVSDDILGKLKHFENIYNAVAKSKSLNAK